MNWRNRKLIDRLENYIIDNFHPDYFTQDGTRIVSRQIIDFYPLEWDKIALRNTLEHAVTIKDGGYHIKTSNCNYYGYLHSFSIMKTGNRTVNFKKTLTVLESSTVCSAVNIMYNASWLDSFLREFGNNKVQAMIEHSVRTEGIEL